MLQPTYGLGLSWDTDQPQAEMQRKSRRGPAGLASECSVKSAESCELEHQEGQQPAQQSHREQAEVTP